MSRRGTWMAVGLFVLAMGAAWTMGAVDGPVAARTVASALGLGAVLNLLDRLPDPPDESDALDVAAAGRATANRGQEPPERAHLRALVRDASSFAGSAHHRLRPALRDLAGARYEAVFGAHPDTDPRAEERMGPAAWAWLRPDRAAPPDALASGVDLHQLEAIIADLEALGRRADGGAR